MAVLTAGTMVDGRERAARHLQSVCRSLNTKEPYAVTSIMNAEGQHDTLLPFAAALEGVTQVLHRMNNGAMAERIQDYLHVFLLTPEDFETNFKVNPRGSISRRNRHGSQKRTNAQP